MKIKGGRPCRYDKNINKISSFPTGLSKQFWNTFSIYDSTSPPQKTSNTINLFLVTKSLFRKTWTWYFFVYTSRAFFWKFSPPIYRDFGKNSWNLSRPRSRRISNNKFVTGIFLHCGDFFLRFVLARKKNLVNKSTVGRRAMTLQVR